MTRLVHYPFCPRSRAIRLALAELGHDAELSEEQPWGWRAELLALNPAGELPILLFPGAAPVSGVYAISELLDEMELARTGDTDGLFPGDAFARAESRRLVDWFLYKIDRDVTQVILDAKVASRFDAARAQSPDAEALRAARHNLRYHLRYLGHLTQSGDWLAGARLSFADLVAGAHVSLLDYFGEIDWDAHPAAKSWYMRLKSRPAFRSLLADRLAGMPPSRSYVDLDF